VPQETVKHILKQKSHPYEVNNKSYKQVMGFHVRSYGYIFHKQSENIR